MSNFVRWGRPIRFLAAALALLQVILMWKVSESSGASVSQSLPGPSGNLLHIVAYGCLAFLVLRVLAPWHGPFDGQSWPGWRSRTGMLVLGIVFLHACLDEAHQFYVPGRTCSVIDIFLDVLGGLLVLTFVPPQNPSRPRTLVVFSLLFALAVSLAVLGWKSRPFPDRLLEQLLS